MPRGPARRTGPSRTAPEGPCLHPARVAPGVGSVTDRRRVLVVDPDPQLLSSLDDRLRRDGFDVTLAASGADALEKLDAEWPDLVILDLVLPHMSGEELAARVKKRADIPIIVLSAVDSPETRADLLARFAEDYVTKPFHYAELLARITRVLRRLDERIPSHELVLGPDLTLILRRREAILAGRVVSLSPTESRLLATLAANMDRAVTTDQLLSRVWGDADAADPAYVWVTVRRIRRKIEQDPDDPRHLVTDRGGYRLVAV
jgi:DNA-binding response OmpR family regulator